MSKYELDALAVKLYDHLTKGGVWNIGMWELIKEWVFKEFGD